MKNNFIYTYIKEYEAKMKNIIMLLLLLMTIGVSQEFNPVVQKDPVHVQTVSIVLRYMSVAAKDSNDVAIADSFHIGKFSYYDIDLIDEDGNLVYEDKTKGGLAMFLNDEQKDIVTKILDEVVLAAQKLVIKEK